MLRMMNRVGTPAWPAFDRRRLYMLLFALYFVLSVFAVVFHAHGGQDRQGTIEAPCSFCQVAVAGGLAGGATRAPTAAAVSILLLLIAFIAFESAFRPTLSRYLSSARNRAPPIS